MRQHFLLELVEAAIYLFNAVAEISLLVLVLDIQDDLPRVFVLNSCPFAGAASGR
jgi:hypothetical protein